MGAEVGIELVGRIYRTGLESPGSIVIRVASVGAQFEGRHREDDRMMMSCDWGLCDW